MDVTTKTADCFRETGKGVEIFILVQPKASQNRIEGTADGSLKIKLTQPPIEGLANKACLRLLSKELSIPQIHMTISAGQKSKHKTVRIINHSLQEIREKLSRFL
jgi:uncharacterized protein